MTWIVIASHDPPYVLPEKEHNKYGLKGFKIGNLKRSEVLCSVFLMLLFKDWRKRVEEMNVAVVGSKAKCRANCTLKSLCHLGNGKISGGTSLKLPLMKLEKKLMFSMSFQQPSMRSMKFIQS